MVRRSPPSASRWVAKLWRSACGVAVSGRPRAQPQPAHLPLRHRRVEPAAAGADEQRRSRGAGVGAGGEVGLDRLADHRQHRHQPLLAALAGDDQRVAAGHVARGSAPAPRRCAGRSRRAAASSAWSRAAEPRLVAERRPPRRPRRRPRSTSSGRGNARATLGVRTSRMAVLAASPRRSRKRKKPRTAARPRERELAAKPVPGARGEVGAEVAEAQLARGRRATAGRRGARRGRRGRTGGRARRRRGCAPKPGARPPATRRHAATAAATSAATGGSLSSRAGAAVAGTPRRSGRGSIRSSVPCPGWKTVASKEPSASRPGMRSSPRLTRASAAERIGWSLPANSRSSSPRIDISRVSRPGPSSASTSPARQRADRRSPPPPRGTGSKARIAVSTSSRSGRSSLTTRTSSSMSSRPPTSAQDGGVGLRLDAHVVAAGLDHRRGAVADARPARRAASRP